MASRLVRRRLCLTSLDSAIHSPRPYSWQPSGMNSSGEGPARVGAMLAFTADLSGPVALWGEARLELDVARTDPEAAIGAEYLVNVWLGTFFSILLGVMTVCLFMPLSEFCSDLAVSMASVVPPTAWTQIRWIGVFFAGALNMSCLIIM